MGLSRGQLESLWVRAGGSRGTARTAAAVALAESGGNVGSAGDVGLGGKGATSFGLWQIHTPAHPQYDAHRLASDPLYNARAAVAVAEGGRNFAPWTTYKTGAYKPFLGAGRGSTSLPAERGAEAPQRASGGESGAAGAGGDTQLLARIDELGRELRATVPVEGARPPLPQALMGALIPQGSPVQMPNPVYQALQALRARIGSEGEAAAAGASASSSPSFSPGSPSARSRAPVRSGGGRSLGLTRAQVRGPRAPAPGSVKVRIVPPKTPQEKAILQREEHFKGGLPGGY